MKNKILALTLIITILSIVPAFADTASNSNCDISNVFNYLSEKCNIDISKVINNCTNQDQTTNTQNIDIENLTQTLKSIVLK